ncbi:putative ATP-grasp-modified RiPP [Streptomyces sp. NPDC006704]|uniref:putative ATP-grasp-modified RiPP n=1 Tax=Streptomyces sp. NPDC006704 TaxID=3364760 RepID=UPI00368E3ADD
MQQPFALRFAHPAPATAPASFTYDSRQQLNVLPNGAPAVTDADVITLGTATQSTAGSQTHSDDTD